MTYKKTRLKEATITTGDLPCEARIHVFAQILLGFCTAQIALVRHRNPGVEFNVRNYQQNAKLSEKDKKEVRDAINRKRTMKSNKMQMEVETDRFMRLFNVDMDQESYDRTDLEDLAKRMAAVHNIGLTIFRRNGCYKTLEHLSTPVTGQPCYINIVELEHKQFKYFESDRELGHVFFCHECGRTEDQKAFHRCTATCRGCNRANTLCNEGTERIHCPDCNIVFFTEECFVAHKHGTSNGSKCTAVKCCTKCSSTYQTRYQHKCDEPGKWCDKCKKKHKKGQQWCFWTPLTPEKKASKIKQQTEYRFGVYDIEAVQGKMYREGSSIKTGRQAHYANVIVARMWCHLCENKGRLEHCVNCGDREKVFKYTSAEDPTDKVINEFREFIISDPTTKGRTFFAHNASRYDSQMLLQSFIKAQLFPKTIMDGFAIVRMGLAVLDEYVYFKDSYRLIPCPVADMPKNFKLQTGLVKGTFPYLFNRPENYGTTTQGLPHDDYFGTMTEKKKKELDEYRKGLEKDYEFIFDDEIIKYCKADVAVVQESIISYRKEVLGVTGWCPFSNSNTIASYVLHVLVNNYAPCDQMVYLPETGVSGKRINQSELAMKWLLWKEQESGKRLQTVMNDGEYMIPETGFHVDGFDGEKTVYEVLGCYWHGCSCMGLDTFNIHRGATMRQLHEQTEQRLAEIRSHGYTVVTIRECHIKEELKADQDMALFFKKTCVKQYSPLIPREGVLGGRTENFRFRVVPGTNQKIRYLDIVSLYPYVMYDREYPLGAPDIITNFTGIDVNGAIPWKGLLKVKVLPPQNLRIPVLGYRCNETLVFPLCRTCSELSNLKDVCTHTDEQRALIGTYTHAELQKAVDRGYKILQYYEVWSWKTWTKNMYKEFINIFLKMKVEATGWEDMEGDEERQAAFIAKYREKLGIEIDPANMRSSPGRRYIAKLMLNTLWGKMCQRDDLAKSSYSRMWEMWDKKEIKGYRVDDHLRIDRNTVFTTWKPIHEMRHSSTYAALHHAAFVTSYGRLRLYEMMEKAGEGLMYCDTDSVIFLGPKDVNPLEAELTNFFGDLSDEINPDETITGVTIVAPKAYVVEISKSDGGKVRPIVKMKGVHQNTETSDALKIENYHKLAESRVRTALAGDDKTEFSIAVQQSTIKKSRTLDLNTEHFTKVIRAKSRKGAIRGTTALDAHRVPYGYRE